MSELETSRLKLRQWRDEDFAPFAMLNADAETMRYFPSTLGRAESDALAMRCRDLIAAQGWGFWATEIIETGDFVGFIGLRASMSDLPFEPCVEIACRLSRKYWGKGLALEGAQAALEFGFDQLKLEQIASFTSVHNSRSEAVMKRLGMMRDVTTFLHPALPPDHHLAEHCLYRVRRLAQA